MKGLKIFDTLKAKAEFSLIFLDKGPLTVFGFKIQKVIKICFTVLVSICFIKIVRRMISIFIDKVLMAMLQKSITNSIIQREKIETKEKPFVKYLISAIVESDY